MSALLLLIFNCLIYSSQQPYVVGIIISHFTCEEAWALKGELTAAKLAIACAPNHHSTNTY